MSASSSSLSTAQGSAANPNGPQPTSSRGSWSSSHPLDRSSPAAGKILRAAHEEFAPRRRNRLSLAGGRPGSPPWATSAISGAGLDAAASWRCPAGASAMTATAAAAAASTAARPPSLGSDFCGRKSTRLVSKLSHLGRPSSAPGKPIKPVLSSAVKHMIKSPSPSLMPALLDQVSAHLLGPDDLPFIVRELGHSGQWEKVVKSFDWMVLQQNLRSQWDKVTSTIISSLGRLGRSDWAQLIFDRAVGAGFGNNVFVYSSLICAYGRSGKLAKAVEIFEAMKVVCKPNLVVYNAVIDACSKGGDYPTALRIFREMLEQGMSPDRITFNTLISAAGRANRWEECDRIFAEMEERGIARDDVTYNTLIATYCRGGQMHLGAALMETMAKSSGIEPSVITYSTMIDGYAKLGLAHEAIALFQEMRNQNVEPDGICYNTMVDIHARLGNFDEAHSIRRAMEEAGFAKDIVTYNALLDSYGKQGKFREAMSLLEEMKQRGASPNILTYSALIDAYCKHGFHRDAMALFQDVKKAGLQPDVVLYSTLVDGCCKNGSPDEALALLEEMADNGIRPNVITYNSLLDAYGRQCLMMQDDQQSLVDPKQKQALVLAAARVFREMAKNGVKPNVVTFSSILNACSHCASVEDASNLLEAMRVFDGRVYGVTHGLLMGFRIRVWRDAETLFNELTTLGHNTAVAFYNALTDVLWHFEQRNSAQRVVEAAKDRHVWDKAWWHSEQQFFLDLHFMSVGSAQAMLHLWLLYIRKFLCQRRSVLPKYMSILTGWGKHSKVPGESAVKRAVEAHLLEMNSPFHVWGNNEGRLVCAGYQVQGWLMDTRTQRHLRLCDVRGD